MRRNLLTVFALTLAVVLTGVNAGNAEILRCSATVTWADTPRRIDVTIVRPEERDFDKVLALVDKETGLFKEFAGGSLPVGVGIIEIKSFSEPERYKFIEFLSPPEMLIGMFFDNAPQGRNPNLVVAHLWEKPKRVYLYLNLHVSSFMGLHRPGTGTCD